jgi:putative extracellular protein
MRSSPAQSARRNRCRLQVEMLEDRTVPTGMGYQNGISPEYMINLANELHSAAWTNMPHMADDDYVRSYAAATTMVAPAKTAYVVVAVTLAK